VVEANKALQAAQYQAMQAQSMQANTLQRQNYDVQTQHVQREPVVTAPKPDNKALEWQQRNQWFGQKRAMTAYAFGVHEELKDSGVTIGSDKYYKELDKAIRKRFPDEFEERDSSKSEGKKKVSSPVAPASRSTASNKVKLSLSELNLAKKFNLTPEQFALEKLKLERTNG
jgi:hypothetical protein